MTALKWEVVRRPGVATRPERNIGSGVKIALNGGACLRVGDIHFTTVEPQTHAHAQAMADALAVIESALRAAGIAEISRGGRKS